MYRIPVATHNVGGILLTMASVHFGASLHDFLITETRLGSQPSILSMAANPPVVEHGAIEVPHTPGLGVELSDEGVKAWQAAEDSGWV
jgi:galactonate dehydratase